MTQASLLKSGFWSTYGAFAARGLALVSNLILARLLLPVDYGVIGVAYIFWAFANLFTQGTIDSFVVYHGIGDRRALNTAYSVSWILGGGLALGLLVTSPLIAKFFAMPALTGVLSLYSINLLLSFLYTFYTGILRERMQYREIAQIMLIGALARVALATVSAWMGLGYWSFVIGDLANWIISCLLIQPHLKLKLQFAMDPKSRRAIMLYCLGAAGSSLGFYVNANFDSLVVGKIVGNQALGYYNFAYQITMAASIVLSQAVVQLGTSVFAKQERGSDRRHALQQVMNQLSWLAAPLFILLYLGMDPAIIQQVFGEKWLPACAIIPWLLIFSYFRLLTSPLNAMLSATGNPHINARANLVIAPIAVLSFIIGAQHLEIMGVSIAAAIVLGGLWTGYWWYLGCRQMDWKMLPFILPMLLFAGLGLGALALVSPLPLVWRFPAFSLLYLLFSSYWSRGYLFGYWNVAKTMINKFQNWRSPQQNKA
ncbi:MAG: oligosaccharide flippase family protein [Synechococcales cyanobacterium RM1_1_8]|nr:oligosaccharide flippase family protein [Synechococcales cyanobacterium RM1_1_8]